MNKKKNSLKVLNNYDLMINFKILCILSLFGLSLLRKKQTMKNEQYFLNFINRLLNY